MNTKRSAEQVIEAEFLLLRAKILEIASGLDRIDRAAPNKTDEEKVKKLREAIDILLHSGPHRAEQIQLLFSRAYDDNWRKSFEL